MKRILSGILSTTIAVGMLAGLVGCGKDGGDTLTMYMIGDKPAAHEEVMGKANEIIEKEIGMKLDMQYIDSASYEEKMKLKMSSGEAYDIAFTGYVNNYQTAATLGGLYDITNIIKEVGIEDVIPEFYLDAAKIDGKIYGIPNIQVVSNPNAITIRESVAKECGVVDLMKQIEQESSIKDSYAQIENVMELYDKMFEKVHEKRPDLYTWTPNMNFAQEMAYETLYNAIGIRRDGTSDKFVNIYDTDEWKLGAQKVREWYQKGYIRNDISSKGNTVEDSEMPLVAFTGTNWKPGSESLTQEKYGESYLYAKVTEPYIGRTKPLATMLSVGANSKNPEKAVEFIKLINSNKELYNLICWGIEGEHYTKNEDGTVTVIKDGGYDGIGTSAWKYGNQFNSFVLQGQQPDIWVETEKMNNEAYQSPMLGFVPNVDSFSTEIANIANVVSEYKAKMEFGTEDFDNWHDEFMSKLEQAGVDKVMNALQKQYDEFLTNK